MYNATWITIKVIGRKEVYFCFLKWDKKILRRTKIMVRRLSGAAARTGSLRK